MEGGGGRRRGKKGVGGEKGVGKGRGDRGGKRSVVGKGEERRMLG